MDSQGDTSSAANGLDVTLDAGGKKSMNTTLWFPVSVLATDNYVATTNCPKGAVYVYPLDSAGKNLPLASIGETSCFTHHKARVPDMAHLFGDVIVSVDKLGKTCIWDCATFEILDALQAPDYRRLLYVKKLDANSFVVGGTSIRTGNVAHILYVFTHDKGRNIKCVQEKKLSPGGVLFGTNKRNIYVKTTVKAFKYDVDTAKKLSFSNPPIASVYHFEFFATVSDNYIVLSYWNQEIFIYRNNRDCKQISTLNVKEFSDVEEDTLRAITVIDANLLMVTTEKYGIFFLDIEGEVVAKIAITKSDDLRNACVLSDGRICVAAANAYCGIWHCPFEVKPSVLKYALAIKASSEGIVRGEYLDSSAGKGQNGNADANGHANGISNGNSSISEDIELAEEMVKSRAQRNDEFAEASKLKAQLATEKKKSLNQRELHAIEVVRLESRLAAQTAKKQQELSKLRKEMEADKAANEQLRIRFAACEAKLAFVDAEKEKLSNQLTKERSAIRKEPEGAEVQAELDKEREENRKYRTEMDIQVINMKAQLDIQKVLIKSKEDALEAQIRKAEAEIIRIRTSNPPPKKRKINSESTNQ